MNDEISTVEQAKEKDEGEKFEEQEGSWEAPPSHTSQTSEGFERILGRIESLGCLSTLQVITLSP